MMYLPLLLALGAVLLIGLIGVRKVDEFIEENRKEIEKETENAPVFSDESVEDTVHMHGTGSLRSGNGVDVKSSRPSFKKSIGCNSRTQIL